MHAITWGKQRAPAYRTRFACGAGANWPICCICSARGMSLIETLMSFWNDLGPSILALPNLCRTPEPLAALLDGCIQFTV